MPAITPASTRLVGLAIAVLALAAGCAASGAEEKPVLDAGGDQVQILSPSHGDELTGPVTFTIDRGAVRPTQDTVDAGGHFWLVIDDECVEVGEVLPVDEPGHIAVPDDQDEIEVDLTPGAHDVCLQFADANHVAYYEVDQITIRVVD